MPISPLSGTVYWIEQIIHCAVHNNRPNVQNVHLLFLMTYEYLTARVTLQKNPPWKSINCCFFLNGNLGKAFSLTKNTMNYPELNLLSTLPGRKSCNSCFYARVHDCICAFFIYCLDPFYVLVALLTVLLVRGFAFYVYSMCFCNYKGIFHSVMLINLISKSRNMKQELKKTDFHCGWMCASIL